MLTGATFGRYEILGKIGEGGMGEVYSAHDAVLDRSVAIKLLPNEFNNDEDRKGRFRQEARVVSALNHPNIITIYEIGENDHGSFLATEFVDGTTLREVMKRQSITLPRILKIIEQTASALAAAHSAGIVHRDVKPENIMVRRDSIVKVLDFGLAKPVIPIDGDNSQNKTIPGTVMGSARYMSPEQARGAEVDERTDVWSLGVVLYEMLVGKAPFTGETAADTIASVIYRDPEPIGNILPNTPSELQEILAKALQKDCDARYQTVEEFASDIKDLIYGIEHENSGGRIAHITSSPAFSENPTMIHRTTSGNHPTDKTSVMTVGSDQSAAPASKRPRLAWVAGSVVVLIVLAAASFGIYRWTFANAPLAATAFTKPQISRLNSDGRVMMPAISPDGKYIAYVAGEAGSRSLVVRQVATDSTVTVVPPTNLNLTYVTFSPTGDYVYYCQTSADFALNTLYQVPALGGTPKKLIEDVDSAVTFSPDGRQFAFARHKTDTNEDVIFLTNTETLAYEPLVSTKDTEYNVFSNRLAWSPDGRTILAGAGKRQSGFVVRTDIVEILISDKKVRPLNRREFFYIANIAWFADGSGFLFTGREEQNGPNQIWSGSHPDAEIRPITNDFNDYIDVSVSSDGRSIATVKGDTSASLWRYSPATKTSVQLTSESRNLEGIAGISQRRDGKILYTRNDGKKIDLWIADSVGKNAKALLSEPGFSVAPLSTPDGKYIIYNLQANKSSGIWRADAEGKNAVALTGDNPDYADFNPQITSDARYVIFQRHRSNDERFELMKVPVEGGRVELFYSDDKWSVFQPRLSPDGRRIAFTIYDMKTFQKKLLVATIEGSNFGKVERELEYNLINQFLWAPDSKSLTVLTNRSGTQNILREPIDGSAATPITEFTSGKILNFAWAADGKDLIISRGNTNNDLILIRETAQSSGSNITAKPASAGSRRSGPFSLTAY